MTYINFVPIHTHALPRARLSTQRERKEGEVGMVGGGGRRRRRK